MSTAESKKSAQIQALLAQARAKQQALSTNSVAVKAPKKASTTAAAAPAAAKNKPKASSPKAPKAKKQKTVEDADGEPREYLIKALKPVENTDDEDSPSGSECEEVSEKVAGEAEFSSPEAARREEQFKRERAAQKPKINVIDKIIATYVPPQLWEKKGKPPRVPFAESGLPDKRKNRFKGGYDKDGVSDSDNDEIDSDWEISGEDEEVEEEFDSESSTSEEEEEEEEEEEPQPKRKATARR